MRSKTPKIPSVDEILGQLAGLRSGVVHFVACGPDDLREAVKGSFLREPGVRVVLGYNKDTHLFKLDVGEAGIPETELHLWLSGVRRGPYALILDYTGWEDAGDEGTLWHLFRFLAWAAFSGEWPWTLRILAVGRTLPWYIQNIEQQTDGFAIVVRD